MCRGNRYSEQGGSRRPASTLEDEIQATALRDNRELSVEGYAVTVASMHSGTEWHKRRKTAFLSTTTELACLPRPITGTVYNYLQIRQHEWSNSVGPEDTDALRR